MSKIGISTGTNFAALLDVNSQKNFQLKERFVTKSPDQGPAPEPCWSYTQTLFISSLCSQLRARHNPFSAVQLIPGNSATTQLSES